MEKTWKPRREWPEVMTVKDLLECVPYMSRDRAYEIVKALGVRVGNNWAIARKDLITFLDGDQDWELKQIERWNEELQNQKRELREFFKPEK